MRLKKLRLPGLLILFVLPLIFSCRKEHLAGTSSLADSTALFSATIDGVDWQTDSVSGFLSWEFSGKARIMTITGYTSTRLITISLRDTAIAGTNDSTLTAQTYAVDVRGNASAFGYAYNPIIVGRNLVWQQQGTAGSGSAVVTNSDGVDKRITGSFTFVARAVLIDSAGLRPDTVNVTNGVFKNIPYSYFRRP